MVAGGHAWLLRGHAWLPRGVHGCWGAYMVAREVCMVAGGACMVAWGHVWLPGGCLRLFGDMYGWQGACVGKGACMAKGTCMAKGACVAKGGTCGEEGAYMVKGGMCGERGHAWDTMRYGHTINERAVRILLECILVCFFFGCFFKIFLSPLPFAPLPHSKGRHPPEKNPDFVPDTCGRNVAAHAHLTGDVTIGAVETEGVEVDVLHDIADALIHSRVV